MDRRYGPVRDNFTVIVIPIYDRKQMPVGKVQFQAVLAYRERRLNKSLELASSSVENEVHQAVMNLMLALGDSIDEVELMARYDEDNPYRPGYSYFNHGEPNPDSSRVASFERKEGFNHKDGRDHPAPRQTPSGYKEWPQQAQDHGDSGQDYNQYHQGRQPVGSGGKHREQMYFKGGRYAKPVV